MLSGPKILIFRVIVLILLWSGTAMSVQADISGARDVVQSTIDTIFSDLSEQLDSGQPLDDFARLTIERKLLPNMDIHKFAKLIVGKHWKKATEQQRTQFIDILSGFLIRTTAKTVTSDPDSVRNYLENVRVTGVTPGRTVDRAVVTMVIDMPNRGESTIAFRMSSEAGSWKLYDVVFEGVSFAVNYRTILNSEINKHGIDEVTRDLASKLNQ